MTDALRSAGVRFQPITAEDALQKLNAINRIDPFSQLLATFLNYFKGGGHTVEGIRAYAGKRNLLDGRLGAFLLVFRPLVERYNEMLRDAGEIDFNDMVIRAADHAETGRYASPYTCILVDEFQDISASRARLVKALASQAPGHRLFCVGDDWQSIYRFAGSDIALMRNFEEQFGFTETVALDRTFRFNDRIEAVATRFVLTNPAQIKKTILTQRRASSPRVIMQFT